MPGAETNVGDHTIAWDVFIPAVLLPIVFFLTMGGYPFFERWAATTAAQRIRPPARQGVRDAVDRDG